MDMQQAKLMQAMIRYDQGDTLRIHHFLKVHNIARTIGMLEGLDERTLYILETAAILHDIGIHPSEAKYGSSAGNYQEIEGPPEAEKLMREVGGFDEELMERVKFLIGHHHTYKNVEGMDWQILIEADFLVNLFEYQLRYEAIMAVQKNIFRTKTGLALLRDMYGDKYPDQGQ